MKTYLAIWIVLVLLIAAGSLVAAVGTEGFLQYTFVPRWRWRGRWRGPGPWPWRWPYGPRWWYVPYVEYFEDGSDAEVDEKEVGEQGEGTSRDQDYVEEGGEVVKVKAVKKEVPIDKVEGAVEGFDSVPAPKLQAWLKTHGKMAKDGFVNGSGYPNGMNVPRSVRYSIPSGSEIPAKPITDDLYQFPPDGPSPAVGLYKSTSAADYLLLSDTFPVEPGANAPNKISCVNSRSCYATDFDRLLQQGGNYRQVTNNYKRGYPDSCSSPYQELVLSFYKSDGPTIDVPANCA
jgi:hypothetical protein